MKLLLPFRLVLLLALSWAAARPALANAPHAGHLTYSYLRTAANGEQTYRVRAAFVVDCGVAIMPDSLLLNAGAGCGPQLRTAWMRRTGGPATLQLYCPRIQALTCLSTPPPAGGSPPLGFEEHGYEGTIALPPAATWTLSMELFARAATANLLGSNTLRLEATLHSLIAPVGGGPALVVTNQSPTYTIANGVLVLAAAGQQQTISFAAADPDRSSGRTDSLAYSLEAPLTGCGVPAAYAAYPGSGCVTQADPRCATRLIDCAGAGTGYSATLPIAVPVDTVYENGTTVRPPCPTLAIVRANVRSRFGFDRSTGSFTFTAPAAQPGVAALGLNKYAVVGQVTEYRKINGYYYAVGSTRQPSVCCPRPPRATCCVPTPRRASGRACALIRPRWWCTWWGRLPSSAGRAMC